MDRPLLCLVALASLLVGCVTSSRILVHVQTPEGQPNAGVTVAAVCERTGGAGVVTDADGDGELVLFFGDGEPCTLTAAGIGFETVQTTDVRPCDAETCDVVTLQQEPLP